MDNVTKIQISDGYLDVVSDVQLPLTFSIAEIQDISKRTGSFSKTITLAGTPNNHSLLGLLFNVNTTNSSFNQSIKTACTIIQNGIQVMSGWLRLSNVIRNGNSFEYEVEVKDNAGDLFSIISNDLLTDLDLSQYNHLYTNDNILATSGNTWVDGYKYHLSYNTKSYYELEDFTPNIFAKIYFDKIFENAGYTYEWNSLEDLNFDKMVIPYNADGPLVDQTINTFRAGFNTGSTITQDANNNQTFSEKDKIIFDQTTFNSPLKNPSNYFSPTTGIWTAPFAASTTFRTRFSYVSYIYCPVPVWITKANFFTYGDFTRQMKLFYGDDISNTYFPATNELFYDEVTTISGSSYIALGVGYNLPISGITPEIIGTTNVLDTQQIAPYLSTEFKTIGTGYPTAIRITSSGGTEIYEGDANYPQVVTFIGPAISGNSIDNNADYFYNEIFGNLAENQLLNMNDFIPKKIKQKDFIKSIIQLFNLYITPSKEVENKLLIKTRDEFYNGGDTLDWSLKLDLDSEIKVEFLPDLQNKKILFTYKDDTDEHNKHYKENVGEVYGQSEYIFESDFVYDTLTIGNTLFSPTPLDNNGGATTGGYSSGATSNTLIVPTIQAKNPKNNIRILYDCGWINGEWELARYGVGSSTTFYTYPHMGHFYPNPINPTDDLNWGITDYLYYDNWSGLTNNNLYNRNYSRFISQIETGKLMVAKFKLTENDIQNLDFRDKIWINDCYWFINKISDYNANGNGLTTVELTTVDDGVIFKANNNIN